MKYLRSRVLLGALLALAALTPHTVAATELNSFGRSRNYSRMISPGWEPLFDSGSAQLITGSAASYSTGMLDVSAYKAVAVYMSVSASTGSALNCNLQVSLYTPDGVFMTNTVNASAVTSTVNSGRGLSFGIGLGGTTGGQLSSLAIQPHMLQAFLGNTGTSTTITARISIWGIR